MGPNPPVASYCPSDAARILPVVRAVHGLALPSSPAWSPLSPLTLHKKWIWGGGDKKKSTRGQGLAPSRPGDGAFGSRSKQAIRAWCRAGSVYSLASGPSEEQSGAVQRIRSSQADTKRSVSSLCSLLPLGNHFTLSLSFLRCTKGSHQLPRAVRTT